MKYIISSIKEKHIRLKKYWILWPFSRSIQVDKSKIIDKFDRLYVVERIDNEAYSVDVRETVSHCAVILLIMMFMGTILVNSFGYLYDKFVIRIAKPAIVTKDNYKTSRNITAMDKLLQINADNLHTKIVPVSGFDLRKNCLTFKNITSKVSEGGNCFGFAYFEKMYFLDKLNQYEPGDDCFPGYNIKDINEDLGNYKLDINSIEILYRKTPDEFISDKNMRIVVPTEIPSRRTAKELLHDILISEIETFDKIKQPEIKSILQAISYFQFHKTNLRGKAVYTFGTYSHEADFLAGFKEIHNPLSKVDTKATPVKDKLDIDEMKKLIDQNEVFLLGLSNSKSGHALLAYSYEIIDDTTFKVYVNDSNFPLYPDEEKYKKLNIDIENNFYVLFKKIENKWHYKYDPTLNGIAIYNGCYNSFLPGAGMVIF